MTDESLLIAPEMLAERLEEPGLVIVEAGFALPGRNDGFSEHTRHRLPRAQFFDIEQIADANHPIPHMIPSAADFATAVGALGISNDSLVICYDRFGMFSAARVWWMLRLFGHERVAILNGGMKRWIQLGLPLEHMSDSAVPVPTTYRAVFRSELYATRDDVLAALPSTTPIVDARPAARFVGTAPEPRAGMRAGHMPGAHNIPFPDLSHPDTGMMRSKTELAALFAKVPDDPRTIYSCGSGITAAALLFASEILGRQGRVYDGSWAEWGSDPDTPIEREECPTPQLATTPPPSEQ